MKVAKHQQHQSMQSSTNIRYWLQHLLAILLLAISYQNLANADSTALKDNPAQQNSEFSNFDGVTLSIDISRFLFLGEYRFLKISDNNGKILFLGQVSAEKVFVLPVHALKTTAILTVEVFTENPNDHAIVLTKQLAEEGVL